MSTQLERSLTAAEPTQEPRGVVDLIRRMTPEIQRALPRHLDADRMARLALTELRRTPQLQRASAESLLGALMWAAQLGLEPGPLGHVYLVPRTIRGQVEVVFVIGYRGLVDLAYRSGQVTEIHARCVWRGEPFRFDAGDEERISHSPNIALDPLPADFVAAYAVAHLAGGGVLREVIGPRHIARAQAGSTIPAGKGPWSTDFEAMARKTAIRRLASLLPQSSELASALNVDGAIAPRVDGTRLVTIEEAEPLALAEPAPSEEAERDPQAGEATRPQHRRIQALLRADGITSRTDRLAVISNVTGRLLGSTTELTSEEASQVISHLEQAQGEAPAPPAPPDPDEPPWPDASDRAPDEEAP